MGTDHGTQEERYANALAMAKSVRSLLRKGWRIVIVHGNGPQVGNLAIQNEESADHVPAQPLFALGAMTQGASGSLDRPRAARGVRRRISGAVSVVTHVVVERGDPAFGNPTKPIGPFFTADRGQARWRPSAGGGWCPTPAEASGGSSPRPAPQAILEAKAISALIDAGCVVVAAGGGGIPVVRDGDEYRGVDAVIDKDFAAERIADAAGADALIMVTGVPAVKLDFGTPRERAVEELTAAEARTLLASGQFPAGSMGPKIAAAIRFVEGGDRVAAITTPELVYATLDGSHGALEGGRGTRIVPEHRLHGWRDVPRIRLMVTDLAIRKDSYKDSVRLLEADAGHVELAGRGVELGDDGHAGELRGRWPARASPWKEPAPTTWCSPSARPATRPPPPPSTRPRPRCSAPPPAPERPVTAPTSPLPSTFREAVAKHPAANVAIVSVPGPYAALEGHKALTAGLDVLLFSDNVPLDDEVALKEPGPRPRPAGDGPRCRHRDARRVSGSASPTSCAAARSASWRRPAPARRR